MPSDSTSKRREFALSVVRRLHDAGYESLWAGGCVRDQLLGREPLDYDVATSATPQQVRQLFGRRHTVAVGAAFGVIIVVGPTGGGQVEVATFRCDATYSDGRHPDSVTFSTAAEDACRRDFTINGLFYDPLTDEVIDHVGGQEDLGRGVVRAIGDPHQRIAEDKLRMLRAVRFTAKFDFALDNATFRAVAENAPQISQVSAERVADEMRKTLILPRRVLALRLLLATGLFRQILPECAALGAATPTVSAQFGVDSTALSSAWQRVLAVLDRLHEPEFPQCLAAIVREIYARAAEPAGMVEKICRRWRLSLDEIRQTTYLVENEAQVRRALREPWPQLQRLLVTDDIDRLLGFAAAVADVVDGSTAEIDYCREKLQLPADQLNPLPLITGDDLIAHGLKPGKAFRALLDAVRDAQLMGQVDNQQQALVLAERLWAELGG